MRSARSPRRRAAAAAAAVVAGALMAVGGCSSGGSAEPSAVSSALNVQPGSTAGTGGPAGTGGTAGGLPRPAHVVVVVEENHSYADIIGSGDAPYLNELAHSGASFTASYAVTHPSQPNYLALFSGSTQGITDDSCPHTFTGPSLASELVAAGHSFAGYSESLPSPLFLGCTAGDYARRHNPWVNFSNLPTADNRAFSDFPTDPSGYASLPTLSFVIPNVQHDMHDGSVREGDDWLRTHLDAYASWARTHNSLLVVTWDEDDNSASNQIPTLVTGANVRPGSYAEPVDHYRLLRTLLALYALPPIGQSADRAPITDVWQH
ncbi:alkaline phosphatase family protein [Streptacidiphilus rugosus]|uniref:alkaline phosphatase family protein n=1 Tax=Streptacidiphilus rugosus TaxID=405783 RepID=UPI000ADC7113|nr:alkaline phosphatase family protein [Streptacidiphilus rugosus]